MQGTRTGLHLVDWVYLVMVLAFVSANSAILAPFGGQLASGEVENRGAGSLLTQVVGMAVYMPALLLLLMRLNRTLRTAAKAWPYFAMLAWCALSLTWSADFDVSARRYVAVLLFAMPALYIATVLETERYIKVINVITLIILVLSVVLLLAGPGRYGGKYEFAIRGIFPGKNQFGFFMGIALLGFATRFFAAGNRWDRIRWLSVVLFATVILLLSNSRTPLLAFVAAVFCMALAAWACLPTAVGRRFSGPFRTGSALVALLSAFVLAPMIAGNVIVALGRSLTLSGRTRLWDYVILTGWDSAWIGAGFKAFWTDAKTLDLRVLYAQWSANRNSVGMIGNGHNGYIDIWAELGFVGLMLFLLFWVSFGLRAVRSVSTTGNPYNLFFIGVCAYYTVFSITESAVFEHGDFVWFTVTTAFFMLSRQRLQEVLAVGGRGASTQH